MKERFALFQIGLSSFLKRKLKNGHYLYHTFWLCFKLKTKESKSLFFKGYKSNSLWSLYTKRAKVPLTLFVKKREGHVRAHDRGDLSIRTVHILYSLRTHTSNPAAFFKDQIEACTLNTAHCSLHTEHCTLLTAHWTLHRSNKTKITKVD